MAESWARFEDRLREYEELKEQIQNHADVESIFDRQLQLSKINEEKVETASVKNQCLLSLRQALMDGYEREGRKNESHRAAIAVALNQSLATFQEEDERGELDDVIRMSEATEKMEQEARRQEEEEYQRVLELSAWEAGMDVDSSSDVDGSFPDAGSSSPDAASCFPDAGSASPSPVHGLATSAQPISECLPIFSQKRLSEISVREIESREMRMALEAVVSEVVGEGFSLPDKDALESMGVMDFTVEQLLTLFGLSDGQVKNVEKGMRT